MTNSMDRVQRETANAFDYHKETLPPPLRLRAMNRKGRQFNYVFSCIWLDVFPREMCPMVVYSVPFIADLDPTLSADEKAERARKPFG